jgi:hypothetical protein
LLPNGGSTSLFRRTIHEAANLIAFSEPWQTLQWCFIDSFLIAISLTVPYPLRQFYWFNQILIIDSRPVGQFLKSFLIVHSQLPSTLSPFWSSNLGTCTLSWFFGEVKGDHASGHFDIQSLIDSEKILIR